jgi:hypothetical protein
VAPAYRDRATGLRGKYIELRSLPAELPVAPVLRPASGGLRDQFDVGLAMAALERIGRFNETLAIDHVDTEYCLRARACGLSIWVHGGHEFAHAIGERRRFRFRP